MIELLNYPVFLSKNHANRLLRTIFRTIFGWISSCILLFSFGFSAVSAEEKTYVGSKQCEDCHSEQSEDWKKSDHFRAMEWASEESIMADFDGESVIFHGVTYRFYLDQDKFLVDIQGTDGITETHEIKYTFGFYPLQQYLIELEHGFLQALNVTWDSRDEADGGQRWYHLQPDEKINPEHPFHWKNHIQNWNARCADCHSTNLSKNYDVESHSYKTTWSEINVGCEACHGPASKHLEQAKSDT